MLHSLIQYPTEERQEFEDTIFTGYVSHLQEIDDVIKACVEAAQRGERHISFDLETDFTDDDWEYIEWEVGRRL